MATSQPILVAGELARASEAPLRGLLHIETWLQTARRPSVFGCLERLPLRSGVLNGVVLDHAMPLLSTPRQALAEVARATRRGARVVIRERSWRWEMADRELTIRTSFRRFGGDLYFGEIERTLNPPREVERIWLLDGTCPTVARMLAMPRSELAALNREDFPRVHEHYVRGESFQLQQFVSESLQDLVARAGLRIRTWLERGGAYLTLVAERAANDAATSSVHA